ncbi:MAG TPA: TadE/TadG family type IV pilus assembly protein [Micromonosporaceae bacterium]|jgi:Flp pilus assembly protein TadG
MTIRALCQRARRDDGTAAIEVALLAPALIAIMLLVIAAMRIEVAGESVDASAHDAARAASISRNAAEAQANGVRAARTTLASEGMNCSSLTVKVDASQFARKLGEPATVRATVTCVVALADLSVPGLPGHKTITSTFTSPIDQYGGRS